MVLPRSFFLLCLGSAACQGLNVSGPPVDDVVLMDAIRAQSDGLHAARELHYPLVLVHGMGGFRPVVRWLDYFYRVRLTMAAQGHTVYCAQTDPFQGVDYRARQLAVQVDEVLRQTGSDKVQIVAHSQGGLDARYLIASLGYGDRVATLVTIASPHHGVPLVDMALRLAPTMVERLATIINALADSLLGGQADIMAQLHDLSQMYIENEFNPANRNDPQVAYFSYAGLTQNSPWVDPRRFDLVNPLLSATYRITQRIEGDNDGLVAVRSAAWGTYLGAAPADHWDEIGQPPSAAHLAFDHLWFYRQLASFLAARGPPPMY